MLAIVSINWLSQEEKIEKDVEDEKMQNELISNDISYIGYYADIDGDTEPDGVIYADLSVSKNVQWGFKYTKFSYEAITGTKDYYVSKRAYEGVFGTKDVLTATGSGKDRFYIMALEDFEDETFYSWYSAAYKNIPNQEVTSRKFGTGKINTTTMLEKWNSSSYGEQNNNQSFDDMWGAIQDKVEEGWFVPSEEEWGAFAYNLEIDKSNYSNYGLSSSCWSSSLYGNDYALSFTVGAKAMYAKNLDFYDRVRLSTTF